MDWSFYATLVGTLASVAGLLVAVLQTVRLRELRRRNDADVWQSINMARSIIRKLEASPTHKQDPSVREAYGKITELFRHLVKQATLAESNFTEDTIRKWREADKLDSPWQEAQARQFLSTKAILSREERKRLGREEDKDASTHGNAAK